MAPRGLVSVDSWGTRAKTGAVRFFLGMEGGFFARLAAAWELFRTGMVTFRMEWQVSRDLSQRLLRSAVMAAEGVDEDLDPMTGPAAGIPAEEEN